MYGSHNFFWFLFSIVHLSLKPGYDRAKIWLSKIVVCVRVPKPPRAAGSILRGGQVCITACDSRSFSAVSFLEGCKMRPLERIRNRQLREVSRDC